MTTDQIALNGAAIINGYLVPPAEVRVLFALISLNEPAIVAQVARQATAFDPAQPMSDPSVASLMTRLSKRDGLVTREKKKVDVNAPGIGVVGQVTRVLWTPSERAVTFFNSVSAQQRDKVVPALAQSHPPAP